MWYQYTMQHGREMEHPRWRDGRHTLGEARREQYNVRVTGMFGQIGMSIDLPGVHPDWLRRDAEAHVLGERGIFPLIIFRGLRPPHYRPRREGPF